MSNIIIDITALLIFKYKRILPTGIERVMQMYVKQFASRSTALVNFNWRIVEFNQKDSQHLFTEVLSPNKKLSLSTLRMLWTSFFLGTSYLSKKSSYLFNVSYKGFLNRRYLQYLKKQQMRPVFFVHDLMPLNLPANLYNPRYIKNYSNILKTMAQEGASLIIASDITRKEMLAFTKEQKLACPPILLSPLAPMSLPLPSSCPLPNKTYFVMLGAFHPRKNHLFMLKTWQKLVQQYGDNAPQLIIIGQSHFFKRHAAKCLLLCRELKGFVHVIENCQDEELSSWLYHAKALLFPTLAEGFGLPLLEAFKAGVPVLASDIPIFHEIAGNVPEYADPHNQEQWIKLIQAYSQPESPQRSAQCARIANYTIPSWNEHFDPIEKWLCQLKI